MPEPETEEEVMEECCYWLGPRGLFSMISYSPQDPAWGDTTQNGMGLSISVVK